MCGLSAIFAYRASADSVDLRELETIRDAMWRRGPDGAGLWLSADARCGLAHRRLSIIDLSERGNQPMRWEERDLTITFNGEIYNYAELKRDLEQRGHRFQSSSDTEVLLHLFAEDGMAMLPRLRGMFSFVLFDARTRTLFCARDPYGIKPLYYADNGSTIRFASQVRALLAGGRVSRDLCAPGQTSFFLTGSVQEPFTLYRDIVALPPGTWMSVDENGISEPQVFFSLASVYAAARGAGKDLREDEVFAEVRSALVDSVRHHMIADVPVGAFLSAGLDSTTLVGLVRDAGVEDVQTITLAFEEFRGTPLDEAPLAETVARAYGTRHRTRLLTEREFSEDLEDLLSTMDQPSIDGINTWFVSKAAAEAGLKVALSGLGGDELVGGYNTFVDVPSWVRKFRIPAALPTVPTLAHLALAVLAPRHLEAHPKQAGALRYGGSYAGAHYLRRGLFMPWELGDVMDPEVAEAGASEYDPVGNGRRHLIPDPGTAFARVAVLESSLYMRNQLLRDTDWASMAHSLEVRVPFVDAALVTRLAGLLHHHAPRYRKQLIARSPSRPLPAELLTRKKSGFFVPIHHWIQTHPDLQDWRSVPVLARPSCPWERRWAWVVLERYFAA